MLVFVCVRTRVSWGPCVSELTVSQGKQEGRWEGTPLSRVHCVAVCKPLTLSGPQCTVDHPKVFTPGRSEHRCVHLHLGGDAGPVCGEEGVVFVTPACCISALYPHTAFCISPSSGSSRRSVCRRRPCCEI